MKKDTEESTPLAILVSFDLDLLYARTERGIFADSLYSALEFC